LFAQETQVKKKPFMPKGKFEGSPMDKKMDKAGQKAMPKMMKKGKK
jgi:hypothetical protein